MQLTGCVDHLNRECVLVASNALNLSTVAQSRDDDRGSATSAQPRSRIIRIANLRHQYFRGPRPCCGKVRPCHSATSIDFVATGATGFPEKYSLAGSNPGGIYGRL